MSEKKPAKGKTKAQIRKEAEINPGEASAAVKALWSSLDYTSWSYLLHKYYPESDWKGGNSNLTGKCPFHDDVHPSFNVSLAKGIAKCFSSTCNKAFTDPIQFLSHSSGSNYSSVLNNIIESYSGVISPALKANFSKLIDMDRSDYIKGVVWRIFKECLHDSISAFNSKDQTKRDEFGYAFPTLEWLQKRSIPEDYWGSISIGILPIERHLFNYIKDFIKDESLTAEIKTYLESVYKHGSDWLGSLVFPYYKTPSQISRFKLRIPTDRAVSDRHSVKMVTIFIEDKLETSAGFFGLAACDKIVADQMEVFVVEGEFDQIAIYLASLGAFSKDKDASSAMIQPVIATGGTLNSSLDPLYNLLFQKIRVIADTPSGKGEEIIANLIRHTEIPFDLRIFTWPIEFLAMPAIKDPDNAILSSYIGPKRFLETIHDDTNYRSVEDWLTAKLEIAIDNCPSSQDRDIFIIKSIKEMVLLLRDRNRQLLFLDKMSTKYGVSTSVLLHDSSKLLNEEEFMEVLSKTFDNEFIIIGTENKGNGTLISAWGKEKKEETNIDLSNIAALSTSLHKVTPFYRKIENKLGGMPDFISKGNSGDDLKIPEKRDRFTTYIKVVLQDRLYSIKNMDSILVLNQGIHLVTENKEDRLYFNNNGCVFEGKYQFAEHKDETNNATVVWNDRQNPLLNGNYIYIRYANDVWSKTTSIDQLNQCNSVTVDDLRAVYNELTDIISAGWEFVGTADARMVALFIMISPISAMFPKAPAMFVTAEKSSGKTKLCQQLIGGMEANSPHLLETVITSASITAAGIMQKMRGIRFLLCIDEFEEKEGSPKNDSKVLAAWEILRSVSDGTVSTRGSPSGKAVEFHNKFSMIFSAINLPNDPTNLSRVLPINLKTNSNRQDPFYTLTKSYDDEYFDLIRTRITTLLFRFIPVLKQYAMGMKEIQGTGKIANITDRFLSLAAPMLALLKLMGEDYMTFFKEYADSKASFLTNALKSNTDDILMTILYTVYKFGSVINNNEPTNLLSILKHPPDLNALHSLRAGVYYFHSIPGTSYKHWLIVEWNTIMTSILSGTKFGSGRGSNRSAGILQQQAVRSKNSVSRLEYESAIKFRKKCGLLGTQFEYDKLGIFDVSDYIENPEDLSGLIDEEIENGSERAGD